MKLTSLSGGRNVVYAWSDTHPSDESRMRIIFRMLRKLGFNTESSELERKWDKFLKAVTNPKSPFYNYVFPPTLLKQLTEIVYNIANAIALNSYPNQLNLHSFPVAKFLNGAWEEITKRPDKFDDWETSTINRIKDKFDIT